MGAVLPPLPKAFCLASEIPSGPQGSKRAGAVIQSGAHAGGQWQWVQMEQPQPEPLRQAHPPLNRKRNNNPELAKNEFFPYKREERFHIHRNHQVGNAAGTEGPGEAEEHRQGGKERWDGRQQDTLLLEIADA